MAVNIIPKHVSYWYFLLSTVYMCLQQTLSLPVFTYTFQYSQNIYQYHFYSLVWLCATNRTQTGGQAGEEINNSAQSSISADKLHGAITKTATEQKHMIPIQFSALIMLVKTAVLCQKLCSGNAILKGRVKERIATCWM